jgi:UDP-2-acetamido-2,6-beta-L-arabino-hexul-4-ose reductase
MKVLITGSDGFVGKNLAVHLRQRGELKLICIEKSNSDRELADAIAESEFIFHLAGVNRPADPAEFAVGNRDLTTKLAQLVSATGRQIPIVVSSSIQAERDNLYGQSKLGAEDALLSRTASLPGGVHIFRLQNIFGKWCRPNYNSAIATFCHNISRGLPICIHDPASPVSLVYIDDVVNAFIRILDAHLAGVTPAGGPYRIVEPVYQSTVGEIANAIQGFHDTRKKCEIAKVGTGFIRALYATYLSYLEPADFAYGISKHEDPRGEFAEVLKTTDSGQVSFFTAHPGITRGGHYHHTKNEKFLVVRGRARFGFRQILTGEAFQLEACGTNPQVVDTVPGWSHDITNVGDEELIVMLWANEVFDRQKPDTIVFKV